MGHGKKMGHLWDICSKYGTYGTFGQNMGHPLNFMGRGRSEYLGAEL